MKIVFLERNSLGSDVDLSMFDSLGEVTSYPLSDTAQNPLRCLDADIIILNKIRVDETLLGSEPHARLICLTATGTNNVDFAYTSSHGIAVANVKGYSTDSVVQHTFAMCFYLLEKLSYYDRFVKSGEYAHSDVFSHFLNTFHELSGKTWGIIGLGAIGRTVARIACDFGCRVIYYSTTGSHDDPDYERTDLDTLLTSSDVISIHAPLNDATRDLIAAPELSKMKSSAILLNLGRGFIVNETDLADALERHVIAGAGLDVLGSEPINPDNPLLRITDSTRLLITPHIAWATLEARKRCADEVFLNIQAFLAGEERNICK